MNRETVADMAFYAYTLEECIKAEKAVTEWLSRHPEDGAYLSEVCSQLGLMKLGAQQEHDMQETERRTAA